VSAANLIQQAMGWLGGYFDWLKTTLASDTARRAVIADLGLDPDNPPPLAVPGERITSIDRYRDSVDPTEQAFLGAWRDVLAVVEAIEAFVDAAGAGAKGIVKETVRQFLSLTATEYLRLRNPKVYFVGRLFAVIEDVAPRQFHGPVDVLVSKDVFSNLLDLIEAPIDHFGRAYSTPETEADAQRLAANTLAPLGILLAFWEKTAHHVVRLVGAEFELPERTVLHGWDIPPSTPTPLADRVSEHVLSFSFGGLDVGAGNSEVGGSVGATLAWVPREHGGPGLYLALNGAADLDSPLGKIWQLNVKKPTPNVVDVLIWDSVDVDPATPGPATPAAAAVVPAAAGAADDRLQFTMRPVRATPQDPYVLTVFGTRIEIGNLSISAIVADDSVELKVLATQSAVVVRPEDGDGFVARLLPESGARLAFDLGLVLAVSPEIRVRLEGGSGLQATIPLNKSIGPARLQQLYLELASGSRVPSGGLRFETSMAASLKLGPITATVDRVGFELVVDTDGGRPPDIGFKAPTGVGLVIDADVVSGSGYLFHDAAKGQYAGVIQLELKGLTLQAIGLITTRLPSGRRGFSLLVIISAADFAPINLGFGFTLTGIGGVVGYNRTVAIEPLRAGLKQGALDTILFPANPVRDAPRIVSVLETVLPPKEDQFLIGPTARISWGVPALLTIELAIIIEGPSPARLIVLGQLRAVLPTEAKALVVLQMDALGVVDFDRGDVAVDAVLYDSKITRYSITGDMALRARFGSDPTFALAVGGLHPKFNPPAGFPSLARVSVGLSQGDNTRLTLQAYFALTSNTAQVGARLDVLVKASGFSVEGSLGFDALFQFSPFSFIVDIHAGVTLKWHGRTLFGVELDLTLSGPSPWHARGKATFKIWRFSKSVSFDRTIGDDAPPPALPPADPMPELVAALADRRNWSAQLPPTVTTLVTMRDTPPTTDVLLHPLGELTVRQRVVPLGIEIDRFGSTSVVGDRRFDVEVVAPDGEPASKAAVVMDHFAAAQFIDMTDAARLQRPSFDLMGAGVRVGETGVTFGGRDDPALIADADMTYETVVVGVPGSRDRRPFAATVDDLRLAAANGAVARSPARHTGPARYRAAQRAAAVPATAYTIVSTADLSSVPVPDVPAGVPSYTAARQALDRHVAAHPELRDRLQVVEVVS
jgi:predicted secreted protein